MQLSEIERYQKRLKRLIKNVPKGYKLCYDMMDCNVYVVAQDAVFHDNEHTNGSSIYAGGGCPVSIPGFSPGTGNDADSVIGDGIYIDMEAVQS